ncbi:MAG: hypothetical protein K9M98_08325 [Cephaloticoccus sp.]|nr:hypothetical protein [Cephaloticoccus sp.]MCF7760495.1 hypothetical protein [Cephaloticoccus sp.]
MSIINNALKKAQRQRAAGGLPVTAGMMSRGPIRRGSGLSASMLALLIGGSAAIIIVTTAATVYLLRSEPTPAPADNVEPASATVGPAVAVLEETPVAPKAEVAHAPVATAVVMAPDFSGPQPAASPPAGTPLFIPPSSILPNSAPLTGHEATYAFIDQIQVMGVRSSGADSKVLMNEKVYRLNDIVDRALMLRLVQVSADTLTFLDSNGYIYTKNF